MPVKKMPPRTEDPGYWRFRAGNARKQAEEMNSSDAKAILVNIAEQYEQLARMTEEQRRQTPPEIAT